MKSTHGRDKSNGFVLANASRHLAGEFVFCCYNLHNDICISDFFEKSVQRYNNYGKKESFLARNVYKNVKKWHFSCICAFFLVPL